eukprot:c40848_g1_i1 orf=58-303(-)
MELVAGCSFDIGKSSPLHPIDGTYLILFLQQLCCPDVQISSTPPFRKDMQSTVLRKCACKLDGAGCWLQLRHRKIFSPTSH